MADPFDFLSAAIKQVFEPNNGQGVVVSEAPGTGPESERTGHRVLVESTHEGRLPLGYIAEHSGKGRQAVGYGGSGDATVLDTQADAEVQQEIRESIARARGRRQRDVAPHGRVRLSKMFSLEGHMEWSGLAVAGPYSLFNGNLTAPGAGNSVQTFAVTLPAGVSVPAFELNRYPGALYYSIFVKSFAISPLTSAMTGTQECFFLDPGGAVVGLGVYNPANVSADQYQNIATLCATPLTDAGLNQIGTLVVNNISIGGTPAISRFQLNVSYIALYPDPWFNEQVLIPPTPAELIEGLRTSEASG